MIKLVLFLKKIYVLAIFVFLEIVAINFYTGSTIYTKAKMIMLSNHLTGGVYSASADIKGYFGLKKENRLLMEEVADLRTRLSEYHPGNQQNIETDDPLTDHSFSEYIYKPATIINNSVIRPDNFITIDKGRADGMEANMALISPEGGLVGFILEVSDKFSVAISVLNVNFRTGGKIKDKDFFGSIQWDGNDMRYVTLSEIPKYADINAGDTIVTGYSSIFPPDIMIGTVVDHRMTASSYIDVKVELTTDIARLRNILVVRYSDIIERMLLEEEYFNEKDK